MRLLFIGNESEAARLDNTVRQHSIEMEVSGPGVPGTMLDLREISNVTDYVLDRKGFDYIMYDVRMFVSEPTAIATEIRKIERTNNVPVIIAAFGLLETSNLVTEIVKAGFKNIIIESEYSAINRAFSRCINGYFEANGVDSLHDTIDAVNRMEEQRKIQSIQYIAVAGTQSRIGTTTQAMQIVKYLNYKGQKACYIEYGSDNLLGKLKDMYKKIEELPAGGISYNGVDLYKISAINTVRKSGYTHLVYDFGSMQSNDFAATGFMDKDAIKVIVAGIDEKEIEHTDRVLDMPYYYDAHFIFSFVAPEDQREVSEKMLKRSGAVHYAAYTPDKFVYTPKNNPIYESLIPLEDPQKKKGLLSSIFNRRK